MAITANAQSVTVPGCDDVDQATQTSYFKQALRNLALKDLSQPLNVLKIAFDKATIISETISTAPRPTDQGWFYLHVLYTMVFTTPEDNTQMTASFEGWFDNFVRIDSTVDNKKNWSGSLCIRKPLRFGNWFNPNDAAWTVRNANGLEIGLYNSSLKTGPYFLALYRLAPQDTKSTK
jgi:hypothetical protein